MCLATWLMGFWFPDRGLHVGSRQWGCWVLITGWPGNCLEFLLLLLWLINSIATGASQIAQTVKNRPAMQETWAGSLGDPYDGSLDPLEKGMATYSSILAWRIPRTEESGRLQYMRSQRVRQDWVTNTVTFFFSIGIRNKKIQFSSVAQSCPTLYDPMNRSTPGLPVHHQLLEFTQTHVHRVGDAIQPSHPLLSPSPPAPNSSQHQSLFQWVNSSHEVAKVLEFQL